MLGDFISLLMMLVVIAAILYLSYIVSRKLGSGMMQAGGARNIKVIERAYLDREKSVVIIRVGDKEYLLGVSPENVCLLEELEEGQISYEEAEEQPEMPTAQFASIIKSRLGKGK